MIRIKEIREEKSIMQKDLAKMLNKTSACISQWESGKTEPDLESLIQIANALNTTTDYLLGRENYVTGNVEIVGVQLTTDEQQLMDLYRALPMRDKAQLIGFAKGLAY